MLIRSILSRIRIPNHLRTLCSSTNVKFPNVEPVISLEEANANAKPSASGNAYVASYLVNHCGLSSERALFASQQVQFDEADKPRAVLEFLRNQGFSETDITELVSRGPRVLVSNPQKTLLPKMEFFRHRLGLSEAETLATLRRCPAYFKKSLENTLEPNFNYVKDAIGGEKAKSLLRRGSWIFNQDFENTLLPNVDFLKSIGVPNSSVAYALYHFAGTFSLKPDEFKETVENIMRRWGFDPSKSVLVFAIRALTGKGPGRWDKCYKCYIKWGWTEDDISQAFRKFPICMQLSEKKISTTMDFFVNELGRESRSISLCPPVLGYNLEKRIIPRCSVVQLLSSKGLVKRHWSLSSVLLPPEKRFLEKIVLKYQEKLPEVYDLYMNKKAGVVEA